MWLVLVGGCLINTDLYESRTRALADADEDSYRAEVDCDDEDAGVNPGAVETCDGIDQDCDGDIDEDVVDAPSWYPDLDADTFGDREAIATRSCLEPAGQVANALDCDDDATAVHPGAEDVPYDGVDGDCDGTDVTDVDGDGEDGLPAGGTDCDDEDAEVHPGAVEVPYDGVDQDCQDGDLIDQDGDGESAEVAGGLDCDDLDATVYPGTSETWADGYTDNDCDGEPGSAELAYGALAWSGGAEGDFLGRRAAALGDADGDGLDEVVIGGEYDTTVGTGAGALYAVDGTPGDLLADGRALFPESAGQFFATDLDTADLTGDGVLDVLVNAVGDPSTAGAAWIVDGAAWVGAGQATVGELAVATVVGSGPGTYGPSTVRIVGDVTGDGITDIAMSECCGTSAGSRSLGRVAVFSSDAFEGTIEDAAILIDGPFEGAYLGGELDPVGDQDGDGLDDLLVAGTGGMVAAVVGATASGDLGDLAITIVYGEVSAGYGDPRSAGDLDGDGKIDLVVLGEDEEGFASLFTALGASPTRVLDSPTCVFDWSEHGGVTDALPLGDRDGDGHDELLLAQFYSDPGYQRLWILPGEDVTVGGTVEADATALSGVSVVPAASFGYALALAGDVDGDGADDIVVGAPEYSAVAEYAGGATIIPLPR